MHTFVLRAKLEHASARLALHALGANKIRRCVNLPILEIDKMHMVAVHAAVLLGGVVHVQLKASLVLC